jgi:hypothetical protein
VIFSSQVCKLGSRNISARTFPNPDKDLLRDVFHVRTAAEHARDRARTNV